MRLSGEDRDFVAARLVGPFGSGTLGPVTVNLEDTVLSGDASATYSVSGNVNVFARRTCKGGSSLATL